MRLNYSIHHLLYCIAIVGCAAVMGCDTSVAVIGTVTDESGLLLEGASVVLEVQNDKELSWSTNTDESGKFAMYRTGWSRYYAISAHKPGYTTAKKLFQASGNEPITVEFVLRESK